MNIFYAPQDPAHIRREREKARELRASQWWRGQIGRGICYYCHLKFPKEELSMDHVVPIGRGGKSTKKNVVVCCKSCNSKKGSRSLGDLAFENSSLSSSGVD